MAHHITADGKFQSDKYPTLGPDKIVLSFKDPAARKALRLFVLWTADTVLAEDILWRIRELEGKL